MNDAIDDLIAAIEAGAVGDDWMPWLDVMDRTRGILPYRFKNMPAAYRGSVDAALALHAALLPGWWLQISGPTPDGDWMVNFAGHDSAFAATPARALLLATLKGYRTTLQNLLRTHRQLKPSTIFNR
jgi:hypothetical protein